MFNKKAKLFWQIYPPFMLVAIIALFSVSLYSSGAIKDLYLDQVKGLLKSKAYLFEKDIFRSDTFANSAELRSACATAARELLARTTIISRDGNVICDSEEDPETMANHADRPEVKAAMLGQDGMSIRFSETMNLDMMYVALPLTVKNSIVDVVRVSMPVARISKVLDNIYLKIAAAAALVAILAAFVSYIIARHISNMVAAVKDGARRYSEGDFDHKIAVPACKEVGELAVAMNVMAEKLKKLEKVRTDFVANVSHELKTPMTAISGFVETLKSGAIKDEKKTKHFLEIISRHIERMTAIIEDLLNLSRIEQIEKSSIAKGKARMKDILEASFAMCQQKANDKEIKLGLKCDKDVYAEVNSALIEQAVINLIDNAIKFSDPGKKVEVECGLAANNSIMIRVTDEGCGIDEKFHSRIFERFYCVDRTQSRAMGGTGLGLSIVNHIVTAHGGSIRVESTPKKGSIFEIRLP